MLESGEVYDIWERRPGPPTELSLELETYDLTAEDLIRLDRLHKGYPELVVDSFVSDRLAADLRHLESLRPRFSELESLFMRYAPMSAWRVD